jgi:hypothetical protein
MSWRPSAICLLAVAACASPHAPNDARHAHALVVGSVPGSTLEIEVLRERKVERVFVAL